jgi:hypothetical protein
MIYFAENSIPGYFSEYRKPQSFPAIGLLFAGSDQYLPEEPNESRGSITVL